MRFQKVFGVGNADGHEVIANAAVFFGREDVIADGQVVAVVVDEFEGEHSALSQSGLGMLHHTREHRQVAVGSWQLAAGDPSLRLKNGCGQDDRRCGLNC